MRYPAVFLAVMIALGLILGSGFGSRAEAGIGYWSLHGYADLDGDCDIDVTDDQIMAFRYGANYGHPLYDTRYDVEPYAYTGHYDWDIDIKDLQFVFGRNWFECINFWDVKDSMGSYSYRGDSNCSGDANYVDPITVVFTDIAYPMGTTAASRLEEALSDHGLPYIEHDGEQRFWELGECSYEDVDAGENAGGCHFPECPGIDSWERFHVRAEFGAMKSWYWSEMYHKWRFGGGHVTWGTVAVGTAHFDDDDNTCGHFIPEDYPYWEDLCPICTGSGFDAGREWMVQQFGGSYSFQYWGNTTRIHQGCGDNQWPRSNGWVYYIEVD